MGGDGGQETRGGGAAVTAPMCTGRALRLFAALPGYWLRAEGCPAPHCALAERLVPALAGSEPYSTRRCRCCCWLLQTRFWHVWHHGRGWQPAGQNLPHDTQDSPAGALRRSCNAMIRAPETMGGVQGGEEPRSRALNEREAASSQERAICLPRRWRSAL